MTNKKLILSRTSSPKHNKLAFARRGSAVGNGGADGSNPTAVV